MLARIDLRGSALPGPRELARPAAAGRHRHRLGAGHRPPALRGRPASAAPRRSARSPPGSTASTSADFAVPQAALDRRARRPCDPALRAALEEAIARVRTVHADQRRTDVTTEVVPGGTVTERWVPVRRVGPLRARRPGAAAVSASS